MPVSSAAGCVLDTMSLAPCMYGGITFDPNGVKEPQVVGHSMKVPNANKYRGQIAVFDSAAEGWESLDILSSDYPAPRAGHTMTSVGPSALTCGGTSPVVSFEVVLNTGCNELTGKACEGGAKPIFADSTVYNGIRSAILGKSSASTAIPTSDIVSDVYIEDARPKLDPDGQDVAPGQTVIKFAVRPKPNVQQSQVRALVKSNLEGSTGTLAQYQASWAPVIVIAKEPSSYDNANGIAQFQALNAPDGVGIDCWWLTLRPAPRWILYIDMGSLSLSLPLSRTHSLTLSHTLSLLRVFSLPTSFSRSLCLSLALSLSLSLSRARALSLSHTHTCTHTLSLTLHPYIYTNIHLYIHLYIHTYIHT